MRISDWSSDVSLPISRRRWRLIEIGWATALVVSVALLVWSFSRHGELRKSKPEATKPAPAVATTTPPPPVADPVADTHALEATTEALGVVMSRLIREWDQQLVIPHGQNVCAALQHARLECYRSSGTWADLGQMNRPAILTLNLPDQGRQYFLLTALDTSSAGFQTEPGPG